MVFLLGRMRGDIGGDPGELSAVQGVSLLLALRRHRLDRALQLPVPPQVDMRGVRTPRTQRQFRTPVPLAGRPPRRGGTGVAGASFFPARRRASGHSDHARCRRTRRTSAKACGTVNLKGVSNVRNTGNPFTSTKLTCVDGHLVIRYGNTAITYANPPRSFISAGKLLFAQTCSSCHGNDGQRRRSRRVRPPSAPTCRVSARPRSTSGSARAACRPPTSRRSRPSASRPA